MTKKALLIVTIGGLSLVWGIINLTVFFPSIVFPLIQEMIKQPAVQSQRPQQLKKL